MFFSAIPPAVPGEMTPFNYTEFKLMDDWSWRRVADQDACHSSLNTKQAVPLQLLNNPEEKHRIAQQIATPLARLLQ